MIPFLPERWAFTRERKTLWLLQYAAFTTHWLRADDVIRATNGPAAVAYSVALKYLTPAPARGFYSEVSRTDRERLRNHVASYYLGRLEESHYVEAAYPDLYDQVTR